MINNSIQVFDYEDFTIRTYTDENGEVWLVAKDLCDVLGLSNPTEALRSLDDDEKNTLRISEGIQGRGNPNMNIINEAGLYKLTFRSNKPNAKNFTRWVTHEVLPSIRKTGSYSMQEEHKPAVLTECKKQPLPQHSAPVKAAERIFNKAFKAKTDKDFQAVIALDTVFIDTFGRSALDIAGLQIKHTLVEVPTTLEERLRMPRDNTVWTKWIQAYVLVRDDQVISSSADDGRQY